MAGGAGFVRDAKISNDRNLGYLDKFNASHFKRTHYKVTKKRLYKFKQASPEQLKSIKERIRKEERTYRRVTRVTLVILLILAFVVMKELLF